MSIRFGLRARAGALLLFGALLVAPRALRAQGEPTPFWISDPPAGNSTPEPSKKKSKPAKPPKPAKPKSTSAFTDDDDAPPPPKRKAAPAEKPPAPAPVKKKKSTPIPGLDDGEEAAAPKPKPQTKPRYEPLPPLPHLEPSPQAAPSSPPPSYPPPSQTPPAQAPYYQQPYRAPAAPAPAPQAAPRAAPAPQYQPLPAPPQRELFVPSQAQQPAQQIVVPLEERGTVMDPSSDLYKQAHPQPPPVQERPRQERPREERPREERPRELAPLRPDQRSRPPVEEPPPDESGPPRLRRISLEALGGVWSKATSDAQTRDWQIAYGLDFGVAFTRWLSLDVRAVRSSGTDGNANVNATTSHLLFDARLTGVINFGKLAVFAGAGGGVVLEKTQLFLQDVGNDPTTLSSSGLEGIGEAVIGGRWRPWKGFTVRLEVDGLIRQGAFEPIFLAGAGWAF